MICFDPRIALSRGRNHGLGLFAGERLEAGLSLYLVLGKDVWECLILGRIFFVKIVQYIFGLSLGLNQELILDLLLGLDFGLGKNDKWNLDKKI